MNHHKPMKKSKSAKKPSMSKQLYFYGIHAVKAILNERPQDALTLFLQIYENNQQHSSDELADLARSLGISVQTAHKDKLNELCGSHQHQGVVLSARPKQMADETLLEAYLDKENVLMLVLDQISDPHNLGACLRSASAMGVDVVIVPRHHSVGLTPTVAKVSVGGSESVPVVAVTNLARTLDALKKAGIFVFGTALDESALPLYQCDFAGKVVVVMGSEGDGMRRLTREYCDTLVYIPMANIPNRPQSLNVSVATGMVLYEVSRQRQIVG